MSMEKVMYFIFMRDILQNNERKETLMEKKPDNTETVEITISPASCGIDKLDTITDDISCIHGMNKVLDRVTSLENELRRLKKKDRKRLGKWTHK